MAEFCARFVHDVACAQKRHRDFSASRAVDAASSLTRIAPHAVASLVHDPVVHNHAPCSFIVPGCKYCLARGNVLCRPAPTPAPASSPPGDDRPSPPRGAASSR